jgi:capsular exopolysaccharide synthesis family protein
MPASSIITLKNPKSPVAESYRTLRTNIQFSSFDNRVKAIVVTSSGPGEGKTTTSANLAVTTAQGGNKTILIDCDMRNPKEHKIFALSNKIGLSNVLVGEVFFEDAVNETDIENLYILTSGTRPPNPAELLASDKMKKFLEELKQEFDYIIIDTPPIIMVTDAQVLSQYADGCLLVVSAGEADKDAAIKAKELLEKVNAKILGVVLNKLDTSRKGYYGYYYTYYYDGTKGKHIKKNKKGISLKKNNSKETPIP